MAYIKIFGIKSTVKKAVDYITNPDKTDDQNLVSSYGCSPETADLEFAMTAKLGKDNVMEKGDNLAWHMIISFKPGEITDPNVAHEVATKIADATLKGKHEYVLSTHVDKDHVHCHLIFNATNIMLKMKANCDAGVNDRPQIQISCGRTLYLGRQYRQ